MTIICMKCGKDLNLILKEPPGINQQQFWGVHCGIEVTFIVKPVAGSREGG
jgi:hypothetical protein